MRDKQHGQIPLCDIDALLQDTWLQVVSLRHNPEFTEGEGLQLWQRCVANIERVQEALEAAGYATESKRHILYAQCAVLDEAVKGRGVQDDACVQWYSIPLQGHFLGSIDAGDALYDRIRQVLKEPAPDIAVLTCFQRVLTLGFLGGYRTLNDPEREKLVQALNQHVPPFNLPPTHPILAKISTGKGIRNWFSSWPVRITLSVVLLVVLWCGLNRWLDHLLVTLLPGVGK